MKQLFLKFIRGYQKLSIFNTALARQFFLSESVCRFTPRCSEYTYQAIEKYGVLKGGTIGLKRIVRCHPWSKGGQDELQ